MKARIFHKNVIMVNGVKNHRLHLHGAKIAFFICSPYAFRVVPDGYMSWLKGGPLDENISEFLGGIGKHYARKEKRLYSELVDAWHAQRSERLAIRQKLELTKLTDRAKNTAEGQPAHEAARENKARRL